MRTIWVGFNLLVSTVSLSCVALGAAVVGAGPGFYDWLGRFWSRWMLRVSKVGVRLEGTENLRMDAPQIVASNHQSWYDVWTLAAFVPGRYHFVAKKELSHIPLFGRAWQAAGHISVDRSDTQSAVQSLQQAGDLLRQYRSKVVIFPEGTRTRTGRLQPFKKGAFMLAIHSGVEIVPTAVLGSRCVLPKGGWRVRPGQIIVRFGPPIASTDYDEERRDDLIARVREEIHEMLTGVRRDWVGRGADRDCYEIEPEPRESGPGESNMGSGRG